MDLKKVRSFLANVDKNFTTRPNESIRIYLSNEKEKALKKNNEAKAKDIWCLENILAAQNHYVNAYKSCKNEEFYNGWCELERAEIKLLFIRNHVDFKSNNYFLEMMNYHIPKFQSLFPYKVFFSPEFVGRSRCSICNAIRTPRKKCGHTKGDIYKGQMCINIMEQLKLLTVSIVENPVQKSSVAFLEGGDHYNYALPRYYIENTKSPFDSWGFKKTNKTFPHSDFLSVSHDEACPCSSKISYKDCCLLKPGVTMPHLVFHFSEVSETATLEDKLVIT